MRTLPTFLYFMLERNNLLLWLFGLCWRHLELCTLHLPRNSTVFGIARRYWKRKLFLKLSLDIDLRATNTGYELLPNEIAIFNEINRHCLKRRVSQWSLLDARRQRGWRYWLWPLNNAHSRCLTYLSIHSITVRIILRLACLRKECIKYIFVMCQIQRCSHRSLREFKQRPRCAFSCLQTATINERDLTWKSYLWSASVKMSRI